MEDLYLQSIYVYPIKSLGGVSLQQAEVQRRGLQYDRRWMLTDAEGNFLSQREFSQLALLQVNIVHGGLLINHKEGKFADLFIGFDVTNGKTSDVNIWEDRCEAVEVSSEANEWFARALGMQAKLVYMPDSTKRLVDNNYATNNEVVSFADAYPLMILGQSSLNDLNSRLDTPVLMNRFRPNLVFTGGVPFYEDSFDSFKIGNVCFKAVKPCYRCILTTINQEDGTKGQEPLKTLATYRSHKNKVMFGQNLVTTNPGIIEKGDRMIVL